MPIIRTDKPLRKRADFDYYPTPIELCRAAIDIFNPNMIYPREVLDPGAGDGVWGQAIRDKWNRTVLTGVEIQPQFKITPDYNSWHTQDYLSFNEGRFDFIVGNPPYHLASEFIEQSYKRLRSDGYMMFLLRLAFLESQKRYTKFFSDVKLRPKHVFVSVRRISFTNDGKSDNTAYALFVWHKQQRHTHYTSLSWLDWRYDEK